MSESFEEKISRMARRFDLRPLVELLRANGYRSEELLFESTNERTSAGAVDAVTFLTRPRTVKITVNVGLLGDNSLLPSYFFAVVDKSPNPEKFYDFIRFFDHKLIDNYYRAAYPETDTNAYRDWDGVQQSFTRMLGMASTSTLSWLVKAFFPELRVQAERRAFSSTTASHACKTGVSRLDGTGILGRVYESDSSGFVVDLFADEETDARGRAWPHVVRSRLEERVLPILAVHRIPLVVRLRVLFHASWVHVDAPVGKTGYLGFERIRGDAEEGHTLVVYRGITGEDAA